MVNFLNEEKGNITLWLVYVMSACLIVVVWILVYFIIDTEIFPIAVATGADSARPYTYMVIFFKWFPLLAIVGLSIYAIINSQKPDPQERW